MAAVGQSVARKDGIGKATGGARYADDIAFPGMLFGRTIRSTIPRGRIRSLKLAFDTTGFTIVDYRDVPAKNAVDLMSQDQPFLVETEVRHMAEPIVCWHTRTRRSWLSQTSRLNTRRWSRCSIRRNPLRSSSRSSSRRAWTSPK